MSGFGDYGTDNKGLAKLDEDNPSDCNKENFCQVNLGKVVKILPFYHFHPSSFVKWFYVIKTEPLASLYSRRMCHW